MREHNGRVLAAATGHAPAITGIGPSHYPADLLDAAMGETDLIESMRSGEWMAEHRTDLEREHRRRLKRQWDAEHREERLAYQREYHRRWRAANRQHVRDMARAAYQRRKAGT